VRILISIPCWGRDYSRLFSEYSLATQLSACNIPALARRHSITYHILTTRRDAGWLRQRPSIKALEQHATVVFQLMEDMGYDPEYIPDGITGEKYQFMSVVQNEAIQKSLDYDALVFNYADFIWSDGSLSHAIALLASDVDAVLSFCLPVDRRAALPALDRARQDTNGSGVLTLTSSDASVVAIDHLHPEARRRFWHSPTFTMTPTYLIWPVADVGLLVRAYHQTVLALRVRPDNPKYRAGIPYGSLDGYFTAILAEDGVIRHATDSADGIVFSLYDSTVDSSLTKGVTREASIRACLEKTVSLGQREYARAAIRVRRTGTGPGLWDHVEQTSWDVLEKLHGQATFDPAVFESMYADDHSRADFEQKWRGPIYKNAPVKWLFRATLAIARSAAGPSIKVILGEHRARRVYRRLEAFAFATEPRRPSLAARASRFRARAAESVLRGATRVARSNAGQVLKAALGVNRARALYRSLESLLQK